MMLVWVVDLIFNVVTHDLMNVSDIILYLVTCYHITPC